MLSKALRFEQFKPPTLYSLTRPSFPDIFRTIFGQEHQICNFPSSMTARSPRLKCFARRRRYLGAVGGRTWHQGSDDSLGLGQRFASQRPSVLFLSHLEAYRACVTSQLCPIEPFCMWETRATYVGQSFTSTKTFNAGQVAVSRPGVIPCLTNSWRSSSSWRRMCASVNLGRRTPPCWHRC